MPHAFLLGGTGQIGQATAEHLLDHGWSVTLAQRGSHPAPKDLLARGAATVSVDRDRPGDLRRAFGTGADLLLDMVAYGPEHGRQLLELQGDIGALMVVSSSSVYRDDAGRTLDEAAATGFPRLPDPIGESQPTVEPGPETYSTRKVALERLLLEAAAVPLTVLRPAAISGQGSGHAREWWFVKRILDRRSTIPLAYGGLSRFHTSATENIAALVRMMATQRGQHVLNIADPVAPTVLEIGQVIARHLGFSGQLRPLPTVAHFPPTIGSTPWSVQRPFVLDTSAALALGYQPRTTFVDNLPKVVDWLVQASAATDWRILLPALAAYPDDLFDYAAEDEAAADLRSSSIDGIDSSPHRLPRQNSA